MKELKVGERVTLEVTETDKESCKGCFFDSKKFCEVWQQYPCSIKERSDHKNVIFKEVKRMDKYKLHNEKCDGSKCWACQFTWCCDKYNHRKK